MGVRHRRGACRPLRAIALLALLALVQACGTSQPINRYDFGATAPEPADAPANTRATGFDLDTGVETDVDIDVAAPAWLDTPALVYRLDYADPSQVHAYAQSQWAAPPAHLLAQLLQQRRRAAPPCTAGLVHDPRTAGARLRVDLQEFSQVFSAPESSAVVLRARARVMAPHTHAVLAQRNFDLRAATSPANASGAVHGLRDLSLAFSATLLSWAAVALPASCGPPPAPLSPQ